MERKPYTPSCGPDRRNGMTFLQNPKSETRFLNRIRIGTYALSIRKLSEFKSENYPNRI